MHTPIFEFPDPASALTEPNGLLAVGGGLEPQRLLVAYQQGIFPWFNDGEPVMWWSPDPRMVLFPDDIRITRSLDKRCRNAGFHLTYDQVFEQVIAACADVRQATGTWISHEMQQAYVRLHRQGHAHSFEAWHDGQLVGGLYGVAIGRVFFGESMFHRANDASKVAFVRAVQWLSDWGYELIDCQVETGHLASMGARNIGRADFLARLAVLCKRAPLQNAWQGSLA